MACLMLVHSPPLPPPPLVLLVDLDVASQLDAGKVRVDSTSRRKRIIFLRHGESEWNEV